MQAHIRELQPTQRACREHLRLLGAEHVDEPVPMHCNDIADRACSARSPTLNATIVTYPSAGARMVVCDSSQFALSSWAAI